MHKRTDFEGRAKVKINKRWKNMKKLEVFETRRAGLSLKCIKSLQERIELRQRLSLSKIEKKQEKRKEEMY